MCPDPRNPNVAAHSDHFKRGALFRLHKWQFILAEIGGAAAVLHGIGFWSMPSAWIVGGLALVILVEARS